MDLGLVIFDCDGVLIDSEIIACRVDAEELTALGMPMTTDEAIRRFAGVSQKDMRAAIERELGHPLPDWFEARVSRLVESALTSQLQAIPGVCELVQGLNVPFCIASSSKPSRLRYSLALVNLYELFAPNIFSASEVARGKPAPDLFLYAANQMNVRPEHCLVVEDSTAGIAAAVAAGMYPVGFVGGAHCDGSHHDRLYDMGAKTVIDDLQALHQILGS